MFYLSEYGVFQKSDTNEQTSLHKLKVDKLVWSELEALAGKMSNRVLEYISPKKIKIKSYLGVISVGNIHIEILPKTSNSLDVDLDANRKILLKMLSKVHSLKLLESTDASLQVFDRPLLEILVERYLYLLLNVVKKGVKKEYVSISSQEKFLKGKLLLSRQLREPAHKLDKNHIEYDELTFNRAENRLIKTSLLILNKRFFSNKVQKLCRELTFIFDEVPQSINIDIDFSLWKTDRDMSYYEPLIPYLKFIIGNNSPQSLKGPHQGISFLFPIEELFEKYVYETLKDKLPPSYRLRQQIASKYIATHKGRNVFNLRPDLAIFRESKCVSILDTKWKLLDDKNLSNKGGFNSYYGIKQPDIYQLYTYGYKYLNGSGNLFLIYPSNENFQQALSPFEFNSDGLNLHVIPFDINTDRINLDFITSKIN